MAGLRVESATMDHKSVARWVTWAFLLLMLYVSCSYASSIRIEGIAKFEDGEHIKGGTVIVYEYSDEGAGRMPKGHPLAVLVTDKDGKFVVELADINCPLDIRLVRDHCDWTGASTIIPADEYKKKDHFEIALDATRERCAGRSP